MTRNDFVIALGWTLIHFLWQGAALAGLFGVTNALLARHSADARYAAACLTLLLMGLAPVATFTVMLSADSSRAGVGIEQAQFAATGAGVVANDARLDAERMLAGEAATLGAGESGAHASASAISLLRGWIDARAASLLALCVWLWAAGVMLLLVRFGGGWMRVRRLRLSATTLAPACWQAVMRERAVGLGVKFAVRLCQSALVEVPTVIGWLRPVVLVPVSTLAGLSPAQVEAILVHELMHIRRHDYLVNLAQTVIEITLFYHPAVWWVSSHARGEREHACDDATVRACGGDALMYATALADLEEICRRPKSARFNLPSPSVAANGGRSLMSRIQRLVFPSAAHHASAKSLLPSGVACLIMLALAVIASTLISPHAPTFAQASNERKKPDATKRSRQVAVGFVALPAIATETVQNETPAETLNLLVSELNEHKVPAIGYVQGGRLGSGEMLARRLDLLRTWRDAGLELGIGTHTHLWLYDTPFERYEANMTQTEEVVRPLLAERGKELRYFSYPYLNTGANSETKTRFENLLKTRNLKFTPFTIDNDDWIFAKVYAEARARGDREAMRNIRAEYVPYMNRMFEFYENLSQELFNRDIPQVLLLTPSRLVADSFDDLAAMMSKRGYRFVTMDEATADEAFKSPDTYTGRTGISWLQRWAITRGAEWRDEPKPGGYMEQFDLHKGKGNLKAK